MKEKQLLFGSLLIVVSLAGIACGQPQNQVADLDAGFEDGRAPQLTYDAALRLRIDIEPSPHGLRVTEIHANSPVRNMWQPHNEKLRAALEVGDVIQSVNGHRVHQADDLFQLIQTSPDVSELGIVDKRTNQLVVWHVRPSHRVIPIASLVAQPHIVANQAKLNVLIIALTEDPTLGPSVQTTLASVKAFFEDNFDRQRTSIQSLTGNACSSSRIIEAIQSIGSGFDDTVIVYYMGHGAFDVRFNNDPHGGHFFDLPGKDLLRRTAWDYLESIPGRFKLLISDSCNVESVADPDSRFKIASRVETRQIRGPTAAEWLFLGYQGSCDINAASRNEFAWYSPDVGGWFTTKLLQVLNQEKAWTNMERVLPVEADSFYQEKRQTFLATPATTQVLALSNLRAQQHLTPRMSIDASRDTQPPVGLDEIRTMNAVKHYGVTQP